MPGLHATSELTSQRRPPNGYPGSPTHYSNNKVSIGKKTKFHFLKFGASCKNPLSRKIRKFKDLSLPFLSPHDEDGTRTRWPYSISRDKEKKWKWTLHLGCDPTYRTYPMGMGCCCGDSEIRSRDNKKQRHAAKW